MWSSKFFLGSVLVVHHLLLGMREQIQLGRILYPLQLFLSGIAQHWKDLREHINIA